MHIDNPYKTKHWIKLIELGSDNFFGRAIRVHFLSRFFFFFFFFFFFLHVDFYIFDQA